LTSGGAREKYAIRNELLQSHVMRLTKAQEFLMSDINRFTEEMNELMASRDAFEAKFDLIKQKLALVRETTMAGNQAKNEVTDYTREQILSELPSELDFEKLDDLLTTRASGDKIATYIKAAYQPDNKLNESLSTRDLERLQVLLNEIEYGKVATKANAKQTFGSLLNKLNDQIEEN
jgi:hypothetical protein